MSFLNLFVHRQNLAHKTKQKLLKNYFFKFSTTAIKIHKSMIKCVIDKSFIIYFIFCYNIYVHDGLYLHIIYVWVGIWGFFNFVYMNLKIFICDCETLFISSYF